MLRLGERTFRSSDARIYYQMADLPLSEQVPDRTPLPRANSRNHGNRSRSEGISIFTTILAILPTTVVSLLLLVGNARQ
jgi:hypothetical protein